MPTAGFSGVYLTSSVWLVIVQRERPPSYAAIGALDGIIEIPNVHEVKR